MAERFSRRGVLAGLTFAAADLLLTHALKPNSFHPHVPTKIGPDTNTRAANPRKLEHSAESESLRRHISEKWAKYPVQWQPWKLLCGRRPRASPVSG